MHQNTFLTTPDIKKYLFYELDSGGLEMHQNMCLATPEVKKNVWSVLKRVLMPLRILSDPPESSS